MKHSACQAVSILHRSGRRHIKRSLIMDRKRGAEGELHAALMDVSLRGDSGLVAVVVGRLLETGLCVNQADQHGRTHHHTAQLLLDKGQTSIRRTSTDEHPSVACHQSHTGTAECCWTRVPTYSPPTFLVLC